jgi:lipoate-protein ligase A
MIDPAEAPAPQRWRLLQHGAAHGAYNMGVDEALLASAIRGTATLRFYGWEGHWLSLGYAQKLDAGRIAACADAGVGIVRRVTGGRAVLHGGDLTYCLAAPETALPAGLRGSYRLVADALIAGLASLGVAAGRTAAPGGAGGSNDLDCFATPAEDEICVRGRKLAGSAQRRTRGGVLQHGSIRLTPDPPAVTRAVGFAPGVATSLAELGIRVQREKLQEALTAAFRKALESPLEECVLSASERRSAEQRVEMHPGGFLERTDSPPRRGTSRAPRVGRYRDIGE